MRCVVRKMGFNPNENIFFKSTVIACEKSLGKGYVGTVNTNRPMTVERFAQLCQTIYSILLKNRISFNEYILVENVIHNTIRMECMDKPL